MNYLRFSQTIYGSFPVVCAREGGANTTPFQVAHFALRNTKNKTGEKKTSNRVQLFIGINSAEKQKGKKWSEAESRTELALVREKGEKTGRPQYQNEAWYGIKIFALLRIRIERFRFSLIKRKSANTADRRHRKIFFSF